MRGMWSLVICCLFLLGESAVPLYASPRQFQTAVVIGVQQRDPEGSYHRKVVDAPSPSSEYDTEISIRLNCLVYVGRYESAIDYLPGVFEPGHSIEVSPGKHFLYVKAPGNGEVKVRIVHRNSVAEGSCKTSH